MSDISHGGPAFPIPLNPGSSYQGHAECDGMTLRDYFAAKAMQANLVMGAELSWSLATHADSAYKMADAMLAARGKAE